MNASDLAKQKCVPCEGGTPPLRADEIAGFMGELASPWEVVDEKKIQKSFSFKNFVEAMEFVNKIAHIAEEEGHHPDLHIFYNKVTIELWTHAVGGLSKNDFILAAKIEALI